MNGEVRWCAIEHGHHPPHPPVDHDVHRLHEALALATQALQILDARVDIHDTRRLATVSQIRAAQAAIAGELRSHGHHR